jgi:anti-sigma B factor antagonist
MSARRMTEAFEFDVDAAGDVAVVAVRGSLDAVAVPEFRAAVVDLIDHGWGRLRIDLVDVAFIDSAGLGVLVGLLKRVDAAGGELELHRPSAAVTKVLEITGLLDVLPIER